MKNLYKIIIIVVIFIIAIFVVLVFIRPSIVRNGELLSKISGEQEKNIGLNSEINTYLLARDSFYMVNAEYEKLSMELPVENDLSVLTNEFYEVGQYTGVEIQSVTYEQIITVAEGEGAVEAIPVEQIKVDLVISGTYYQILNFINTIERVPRIIKIEDLLVQISGVEYEELTGYIRAKTFFEK